MALGLVALKNALAPIVEKLVGYVQPFGNVLENRAFRYAEFSCGGAYCRVFRNYVAADFSCSLE